VRQTERLPDLDDGAADPPPALLLTNESVYVR
jgi:hypothetical protein